MISLDMTVKDMKEEVGAKSQICDAVVSPVNNPELFSHDSKKDIYEFKTKSFLDRIRVPTDVYMNPGKNDLDLLGVLGELDYNICMHEGKGSPDYKFGIQVFKGDSGYVFSLDSFGEGFDVNEILNKKESGEKYFQNGGMGMGVFDLAEKSVISYEKGGRISNLMYKGSVE